ncbi:MAG: hypothetical protein ACXAB7_06095 [Candidatus Kariarchaeaceae archaeon]
MRGKRFIVLTVFDTIIEVRSINIIRIVDDGLSDNVETIAVEILTVMSQSENSLVLEFAYPTYCIFES